MKKYLTAADDKDLPDEVRNHFYAIIKAQSIYEKDIAEIRATLAPYIVENVEDLWGDDGFVSRENVVDGVIQEFEDYDPSNPYSHAEARTFCFEGCSWTLNGNWLYVFIQPYDDPAPVHYIPKAIVDAQPAILNEIKRSEGSTGFIDREALKEIYESAVEEQKKHLN